MAIFTIYKYSHKAEVEANVVLGSDDESPCKSYRNAASAICAIESAKVGAGNSYRIFDVMNQKWVNKPGTAPDTSLCLGDERRAWLQKQGGIQPTIHAMIDRAMKRES